MHIDNSSRQPLQNNLLFDITKGSLGYSFICCVGFILVGSLVELPLLFFFPRGVFLKTECFLAKSEAFGALRTLSSDELKLLSVDLVTKLDVTEPLSLSTCCVILLTLQRSKSSSSLQDSLLMLSQLSSEDPVLYRRHCLILHVMHQSPFLFPEIYRLFWNYSFIFQNYSGIIDGSLTTITIAIIM